MKTQFHWHSLQRLARLWLLLFVAACAPIQAARQPAGTPVVTPLASPALTLHAPEIRFGLIGSLSNANVWALFDARGYSYNDYAVRSDYWPRLYHLSVPNGQFEAQAAAGMPSPIQAEGDLFVATVPLRSDLTWTDGSPFTADDVAFTVNTTLDFQLGFDWHAFYDPDWLDHATAVDAHTVEFYFKQAPNVAAWQYGALQGPIVQKAYWAPKIAEATALLPTAESTAQIELLNQKVSTLQKRVTTLVEEGVTATGDQLRRIQQELLTQQGNLDEARNDLGKAQAGVGTAMDAARQALYSVDAKSEPTLGTWIPAGQKDGIWVNEAAPSHPFGEPHFDRATYSLFADQPSALAAIEKGNIDSLLDPQGLSSGLALHPVPLPTIASNATSSMHLLVVNPARSSLADSALRRALFCSIDRQALGRSLIATPLTSFVPPGDGSWWNPEATTSCGDGYDPQNGFDASKAVSILKSAGYTWIAEPAGEQAGIGLKMPDGQPFPPVALLAPSEQADAQSARAAHFVEQSARYLGIPLSVQSDDPAGIRFALFNDGGYDMTVVGWRVSAYPGYLCDWFGAANPFGYKDDQLGAACQALSTTTDLNVARQQAFQVQSLLAQDLPFIPLYSDLTYDVYRGIRYPFEHVLNGLSAFYGAPGLALPASP